LRKETRMQTMLEKYSMDKWKLASVATEARWLSTIFAFFVEKAK
jgi:hypothetical protein